MAIRSTNHILAGLSKDDFDLIRSGLEPTDLPLRFSLSARHRPIKSVYFIEAGFASVVAMGATQKPIEIGLIGREGMSGLAIVFGSDNPDYDTYMQAAGRGLRLKSSLLSEAINTSPSFHRALLRFAYAYLDQTTKTAVANGRNKIEERLARWLLMASDRLNSDELPLTHEFIAMMLGTTRPGVTVALRELERSGLIAKSRGGVVIVDRKALVKSSNGIYVPVKP